MFVDFQPAQFDKRRWIVSLVKMVLSRLLTEELLKIRYHRRLADYHLSDWTGDWAHLCRRISFHLLRSKQNKQLISFLLKDKRARLAPLHLRRSSFAVSLSASEEIVTG